MSVDARIRELGSRHETLERTIEEAQRSPSIDTLQVKALKRQKLKLKEEIESLRQTTRH
ncbi:DUF465 domain-containing protein [Escherichia coli]|jgi:hypothetical protein|nr:DUF465 domain-containing protein [Escherichia coli]